MHIHITDTQERRGGDAARPRKRKTERREKVKSWVDRVLKREGNGVFNASVLDDSNPRPYPSESAFKSQKALSAHKRNA